MGAEKLQGKYYHKKTADPDGFRDFFETTNSTTFHDYSILNIFYAIVPCQYKIIFFWKISCNHLHDNGLRKKSIDVFNKLRE
jgi:hypothetical protein